MHRRRHQTGMTLIEMLAAVAILVMLTAILAQVFAQATRASSRGRGMGEIYQKARALQSVFERDLSGATPDFFACGENGMESLYTWDLQVYSLPPGPYSYGLSGRPFADATMRRMLMGGSDFLVLTSSNAAGYDKGVGKVFYVLRATGQLIRVSYPDTSFARMDYLMGAIERGVDINSDLELGAYEDARIVAENVQRVKFSFLDRGHGAISRDGVRHAQGQWVDDWNWTTKRYLPAAIKVDLHLVDRQWVISDGDAVSNRYFEYFEEADDLRAVENFDANDGESFRFIISLPLGMSTR